MNSIKYLTAIVLFLIFFSCKKEHLLPDVTVPPILPFDSAIIPAPYVYITAFIDGDSVYFEEGLNSYEGATSVFDSLTYRTFNFTLKNSQDPLKSYFQISINNYQNSSGAMQNDLDSSIYVSSRNYQLLTSFSPLSATVVWVDSSGVSFSSALIAQSTQFSIPDVEDIIIDNKKYKKTSVEFNCNVAHNGIVHFITNGKATILFSVN